MLCLPYCRTHDPCRYGVTDLDLVCCDPWSIHASPVDERAIQCFMYLKTWWVGGWVGSREACSKLKARPCTSRPGGCATGREARSKLKARSCTSRPGGWGVAGHGRVGGWSQSQACMLRCIWRWAAACWCGTPWCGVAQQAIRGSGASPHRRWQTFVCPGVSCACLQKPKADVAYRHMIVHGCSRP